MAIKRNVTLTLQGASYEDFAPGLPASLRAALDGALEGRDLDPKQISACVLSTEVLSTEVTSTSDTEVISISEESEDECFASLRALTELEQQVVTDSKPHCQMKWVGELRERIRKSQ